MQRAARDAFLAFSFLTLSLACGGGDDGGNGGGTDAGPIPGPVDAGPFDAGGGGGGTDAGPDAGGGGVDAGPVNEAVRRRTVQTSGGGRSQSTGFRLILSVGAPQPMGTATSASNRVTVGPTAARP
jgi:hypothetical protein